MAAINAIWILTTPRTGSTLLAGYINDLLNLDPEITEWYIADGSIRLEDAGKPPQNNKVFPDQFIKFHGDLDLGRIERQYPRMRYIHLVRSDLTAQAVSLAIADKTGVWNMSPDNGQKLKEYNEMGVLVTMDNIRRCRQYLATQDREWVERLRYREHITVVYECLIQRPRETLSCLLGWMGRRDIAIGDLSPRTAALKHPCHAKLIKQARTEFDENPN